MKYQQTDTWFTIQESGGPIEVKPFNSETAPWPGPGWSVSLTHYRRKDGSVGFCSINWFEEHANEVK